MHIIILSYTIDNSSSEDDSTDGAPPTEDTGKCMYYIFCVTLYYVCIRNTYIYTVTAIYTYRFLYDKRLKCKSFETSIRLSYKYNNVCFALLFASGVHEELAILYMHTNHYYLTCHKH